MAKHTAKMYDRLCKAIAGYDRNPNTETARALNIARAEYRQSLRLVRSL